MPDRRRPTYLLVGAVLGVIALAAFRFAFVPPEEATHYHANFALFANGERIDVSADEYMEDVATCAAGETVLPRARVHLHNNDPTSRTCTTRGPPGVTAGKPRLRTGG